MASNTKRKKRKLFASNLLPPPNDLEYILHGFCMLGDEPSMPDADLWEAHGSTIMSLQGIEHNGGVPWHSDPFSFDLWQRPALWWLCGPGADEPRRMLAGDPAQVLPAHGLYFGKPRAYRDIHHGCVFESERDYILRRGLLTDLERELLEVEKNGQEKKNGGTEESAAVS